MLGFLVITIMSTSIINNTILSSNKKNAQSSNIKLFCYQILYKLGGLRVSFVSLATGFANVDVVHIEW